MNHELIAHPLTRIKKGLALPTAEALRVEKPKDDDGLDDVVDDEDENLYVCLHPLRPIVKHSCCLGRANLIVTCPC